MGNYSYRFTVFTPCYNSEKFLHRVYDSLVKQTYTDFEWLIINDGSTDSTDQLINQYIAEHKFAIQYINLAKNQMLTKNYNLAIMHANGELFLPIGSDDEFVANSLEIFDRTWRGYENDSYAGVSCLCKDQDGKLVGDPYPQSPIISDYLDICINKKVRGEKWGFIRTDILRQNLLPTDIDIFVEEELMWLSIAEKFKTVYINEPLRIYYMNQGHVSLSNISKGTVIKYSKGQRYFRIIMINKYHKAIKNNIRKIWDYFIYIRMSLHNQLGIYLTIKEISSTKSRLIVLMMLPLVYLWYLKDVIEGRVERKMADNR
jgi:glycosyltransferase involved in cell wall biosynthesis